MLLCPQKPAPDHTSNSILLTPRGPALPAAFQSPGQLPVTAVDAWAWPAVLTQPAHSLWGSHIISPAPKKASTHLVAPGTGDTQCCCGY